MLLLHVHMLHNHPFPFHQHDLCHNKLDNCSCHLLYIYSLFLCSSIITMVDTVSDKDDRSVKYDSQEKGNDNSNRQFCSTECQTCIN